MGKEKKKYTAEAMEKAKKNPDFVNQKPCKTLTLMFGVFSSTFLFFCSSL